MEIEVGGVGVRVKSEHKYNATGIGTVKEIKQYQEKWLHHVQSMDTDYQNKHYNINQKDEGT